MITLNTTGPAPRSKRYHYVVRDRRDGKIFTRDTIFAMSRSDARQTILAIARRDTPGGPRARDYGHVPAKDYDIEFTHEEVE